MIRRLSSDKTLSIHTYYSEYMVTCGPPGGGGHRLTTGRILPYYKKKSETLKTYILIHNRPNNAPPPRSVVCLCPHPTHTPVCMRVCAHHQCTSLSVYALYQQVGLYYSDASARRVVISSDFFCGMIIRSISLLIW